MRRYFVLGSQLRILRANIIHNEGRELIDKIVDTQFMGNNLKDSISLKQVFERSKKKGP